MASGVRRQSSLGVKRAQRVAIQEPCVRPGKPMKVVDVGSRGARRRDQSKPTPRDRIVILLRMVQAAGKSLEAIHHPRLRRFRAALTNVDPRESDVIGVPEPLVRVLASFEASHELVIVEIDTAPLGDGIDRAFVPRRARRHGLARSR